MLKVHNVVSGYGEVDILHSINFEVANEIYAILGANGAGKTTLMKTIAKVLHLRSGKIFFNDEDISSCTSFQIAAKGIAYVPQEENIFPTMTVMENLSVGSTLVDKSRKKKKLEEVFTIFPDLADRSKQKAGSLSGGEVKMVAVGRALMQDTKILLMDEPTAGLSPKYVDLLFNKIKEIHELRNVSIIIAEQNAVKTIKISDKAIVLKLGCVHLIEDAKNIDLQLIKEGYCI